MKDELHDGSYANLKDDDSPQRKMGSKIILPKIKT